MSRPKVEDAVILAARHVYRDQPEDQKVLFVDVCRAFARIYALPSMQLTELVNVPRLEDGKSERPDGRVLTFSRGEQTETLEALVSRTLHWLADHGFADLDKKRAGKQPLDREDRVQLTEGGLREAKALGTAQKLGDSGIISRAEWDDPRKVPRDDQRLLKHFSDLTGPFTEPAVGEHTADSRWGNHLGGAALEYEQFLNSLFSSHRPGSASERPSVDTRLASAPLAVQPAYAPSSRPQPSSPSFDPPDFPSV